MADILTEIDRVVDRLFNEFNRINTIRGDLSTLQTVDKSSLVSSLNEIKGLIDNVDPVNIINDNINTSITEVWSITKVKGYADNLINNLWIGVPSSYDTILKIVSELLNIKNLVDNNRVSYDKDDLKSELEKQQARNNIDSPSISDFQSILNQLSTFSTNVGDTDFDYVALFESNLN